MGDADDKTRPRGIWHGRIEVPPVAIPTSVAPPNPPISDDRLRELGMVLIGGNDIESARARKALSWLIADRRVIPWYVKAIDTEDYELKRETLDRLSRFDGDEAFGGLKKGMNTKAADISRLTADVEQRSRMADDVRHTAAVALAHSPHPDAKPLLLTMWNDPSMGVRMTVLHALGEMETEESLALLKRMCEDSDEHVRDEARRYLKLRTPEPKAATDGPNSTP